MPTSHQPPPLNEKDIFQAVAALPPDERGASLNAVCEGHPALRAAVEKLLAALDDDVFMRRAADRTITAEVEAEMARIKPEAPGDQIGNYTLREQIGEGGFGTVWVAEQEKPVRRRVALKIIKLGMDTKEVIARFEQERQALAMMDHPNIARVLDAGATSFGRPYFVMELVRGTKLTKYCDKANLPTAERLRLFIAVCHAVQHAHQKGIIHRDLKPSNILVTLHDGVPVPKVIDFGVAKATQQQRLTDLTIYTQFEQMVGTPLYMSPEQAEMSGLDIDTRSDIYSLGVLLYELLVGHTPFDPGTLMKAGFDEMRRVICEQEPQRPSTFVGTMAMDVRTDVAKHRQTDSTKLIVQIRGDLDWIVMKALEKDRSRRYETANGLAQDIQRHLQNEPVQARPPTTLYRFRRMVRRNKLAFASASAVLAALLIGLGVSTWMFFKERQARERAVAAEQEQGRLGQLAESEKNAAKTEAIFSSRVSEFVSDMLGSMGPPDTLGDRGDRLQTFLDRTVERIGKDLRDQPKVEAQFRNVLGAAYWKLEEHSKAEAMIRESLAINRNLPGNENPDLVALLGNLAVALHSQGRTTEAESVQREGLALAKKRFGSTDGSVADALMVLADILNAQGKCDDAEAMYREVLAIRRKLHGNEHPGGAGILYRLGTHLMDGKPVEAQTMLREALTIQRNFFGNEHPDVWSSLNNLTYVLDDQSKWVESEPVYREALELGRKLWGNEHSRVATLLNNFGEALRNQGKLAEAEIVLREALAMKRKLHGFEHEKIAFSLHNLGLLLLNQSKLAEADAILREALAMRKKLLGDENPEVASSLAHLACVLDKKRRLLEAETMHREALSMRRKLFGSEHPDVAHSLSGLAVNLRDQRKFAEAETAFRDAQKMSTKLLGDGHSLVAQTRTGLGILLRAQGKLSEAEAMHREALAGLRKLFGNEHPIVGDSLHHLAHVLEESGNLPAAEKLFREALAIQKKCSVDSEVEKIRNCLIKMLKAAGRPADVEALYREKLATLRKLLGNEHPDVAEALQNLALALEQQPKLAEAETFYRELLALRRKLLGNEHPDVADSVVRLASVLRRQGKHDEAADLLRTETAAMRGSKATNPPAFERMLQQYADILYREGRYADGEPLYRELLATRRARLGAEHKQTLSATASLARLLADWAWSERGAHSGIRRPKSKVAGMAREAERLLRDCLEIQRRGPEATHWRTTGEIPGRLGGAVLAVAVSDPALAGQARAAKLAEAETLLLEAYEVLKKGEKVERNYYGDSFTRLVRLYQTLEKPDKAAEWQQKLDEFNKTAAKPEAEKKDEPPGHQ
jgi:serine/threonine protein kinase/tetratricopeptide (TPR) repeat protein